MGTAGCVDSGDFLTMYRSHSDPLSLEDAVNKFVPGRREGKYIASSVSRMLTNLRGEYSPLFHTVWGQVSGRRGWEIEAVGNFARS